MSTTDTLLLNITTTLGDIQRDLGRIEARLDAGAVTHRELKEKLSDVDHRARGLDIDMNMVVKPMAKKITDYIEPQLKQHGQILGRAAVVMGAASAVMTGAFWLIQYGLTHFGGSILDLLRGKGIS